MKKFRGQKKYYRRLLQESDAFNLDKDNNSWYDMWHWHPDFFGYGELSNKHRKKHLDALFLMFKKILIQARDYSKPYQAWLHLYEDNIDSSFDAVFFHTPNPNTDSSFPRKLQFVCRNIDPPNFFKDYIDEGLEIGLGVKYPDESSVYWDGRVKYVQSRPYIIYSRNHGHSL